MIKKNRKAQLTIWFVYIVTAILIVLFTAMIIPFGIKFNTEAYSIGAKMIRSANDSLSKIDDANVTATLSATFDSALASEQDNIQVSTDIYKYSWIILLVMLGLILFLFARRTIEVGGVA